ncbi:hypothetical protein [uncultured Gulosibacter sp.]|uniref:hypothetical protein n=1 Tax=uncultured Gulosibacter sp. TaxID=1339167 RepID=UPI00288BAAE2|nr:hypothetical protein [uncultured Gulosibacter sp.]
MIENWWLNALWSVTPTIVIGALFGLIIYAALNADRKARVERSRVEQEERARFAAERAAKTQHLDSTPADPAAESNSN